MHIYIIDFRMDGLTFGTRIGTETEIEIGAVILCFEARAAVAASEESGALIVTAGVDQKAQFVS